MTKVNALIFFLALTVVSGVGLSGGNEGGNGGSVVLCSDGEAGSANIDGRSTYLLDFFDLTFSPYHLENSTHHSDADIFLSISLVLTRLERVDPERSQRYNKMFKVFATNTQLTAFELNTVGDIGRVGAIPANCIIRQAAIRKGNTYHINNIVWTSLSGRDRAGLMMHEIIYGEAFDHGERDSAGSRAFNALLFSQELRTISADDYHATLVRYFSYIK